MLTRCPACGAQLSLDVLVAHDDARELLRELMAHSHPFGHLLVRYLALFRPAKRELRMDKATRLLRELMVDVQRGAITRRGRDWPVTVDQWTAAMRAVIDAADTNNLTRPLQDHGYLHEVLARLADKAEAQAERTQEAERRSPQRPSTVQVKGQALPIGEALQVAYAGKDPALAKLDADAKAAAPIPAAVREKLEALRRRAAKP